MGERVVLLQLSDCHLGAEWHGRDPVASLEAVLDEVERLGAAPDAVLVTGDVTDDGGEAEYRQAAELLGRLGVPVHVLPGNHDDRALLRDAFELPGEGDEPIVYAAEVGELRLLVLDGTAPGAEGGGLDEDRLAWLELALGAAPERPTVIATHHPPVAVGIPEWDAIGLPAADRAALAAILAGQTQVRRILCGHLHQTIAAEIAGRPVLIAPSTYIQAQLDLDPEAEIELTPAHPPGFAVHTLENGELVSHLRWLSASGSR